MINFLFTTTVETYAYCQDIVICLQTYFDYSEKKSVDLINKFWADKPVFDDDDDRFHENSYYWAVVIHLNAENKLTSQWWKDSSLWPPPQDYLKRKYQM